MTEPRSSSIWTRSPLARFFRWLFSWRGFRRVLIVLAWAVTIVAVLYGFENWRGRRAWKEHEQQLLARGEQLDYQAFFPKPVPDDQNFATTPFVASWFVRYKNDVDIWQDSYMKVSGKIRSSRNKSRRNLIDLVAWQMAFDALRSGQLANAESFQSEMRDSESRRSAAVAVLESMKEIEPKLAELRTASARPYARYPIELRDDPWSILLPHLSKLKGACQRLQVRASAELAAGQSAAAMEDVKLMFYLADSVKEEPFVISCLVRFACRDIADQVIWEGLAQRSWSDGQLRELQTQLGEQHHYVEDLVRTLKAEHAAGLLTADLVRKRGMNYLLGLAGNLENDRWYYTPLASLLGRLIPSGWYYHEKVNYSRLFRMLQRPLVDEAGVVTSRISPSEVKASTTEMERELADHSVGAIFHHYVLSGLLVPALGNIATRAATAQTSTDHAALACALERYRLANGNFPEQLDALVPQFIAQLPSDVITGEPYKYRRTDDGQFILYSVGWNETDDGGIPGERLYDQKHGDWIWAYPSVPTAQLQRAAKQSPASPSREPSGQTVLQRIAQNDASVFKLSPEQVQAFLAKNATNAESLLAAFNATSNKEFLREAVRRFPDSPFVLASALANDALPEQRRELIDRFKQASPDNPLANYLSARDHLKNQQPDLALKEFTEASSKNGFHDFTLERMQGLEDMYLASGYSAAEAKALAMTGVQLPSVGQLRQLGRDMSALQQQYATAGDTTSAELLARMGLTLATDISHGTANSLLSQMVGTVVEREFLRTLDPNVSYDFIAQPVNERLAQLEAQDKSIRDAARFFDQWLQAADDGQLVSYFDRLKLYGEAAAIIWARTQLLEVPPAP